MRSACGPLRVLGLILFVDAMMTDMRILCAGEEELMRVRYVSPCAVSRSDGWDSDLWLVLLFLFCCVCLLVVLFVVFGVGFVAFVLASRSYPTHRRFHTEDVKLSLVFSERALDLALETYVSGALRSCLSFSSGLPVSTRSAAACEEKKIQTWHLSGPRRSTHMSRDKTCGPSGRVHFRGRKMC